MYKIHKNEILNFKKIKIRINDWKVWLIRSTFAIRYEADLPKNTCAFIWKFFFSIIIFPFAIISHICNKISRTEFAIPGGVGMVLHLVGAAISAGYVLPYFMEYNEFKEQPWNGILFLYATGPVIILLSILIMIIMILPWQVCSSAYNKIKSVKTYNNDRLTISKLVKGFKEKHCSKIDYTRNSDEAI